MVTLQTADNALKTFYLDAAVEEIDSKISPFLAMIEKTSACVTGKGVSKTVRLGTNWGVGAGSETGTLPAANQNDYVTLNATLKNLYGTIEISDKAVRASANSEGAFVNLLNEEMKALIAGAKKSFNRMLFGDGNGIIGKISDNGADFFTVDNAVGICPGMKLEVVGSNGEVALDGIIVKAVNLMDKVINTNTVAETENEYVGMKLRVAGAAPGQELTGLEAIFSYRSLYGVDRSHRFMNPYQYSVYEKISASVIQKAIDEIEEQGGGKVNLILCSRGVRRGLINYCHENNVELPLMQLGDEKVISFNGIPIVVDDYCRKGTMYLLNTDYFKLYQLCDWQWMEGESGKILKQIPGTPVYTATLVKYAELLCEKPSAQGKLYDIIEE